MLTPSRRARSANSLSSVKVVLDEAISPSLTAPELVERHQRSPVPRRATASAGGGSSDTPSTRANVPRETSCWSGVSAVDSDVYCHACFVEPCGLQRADAVDEAGLWYDAQIVEARGALGRHPVIGSE